MASLISCEVATRQTLAQQSGLTKSEAEAFARDGIDTAGSVADQDRSVTIHTAQSSSSGDRSSFIRSEFCALEVTAKFRKFSQRIFQPQFWTRRNQRNADFFVTDWGHVNLPVL